MAFTGFPVAAFDFYEALDADNTKAFWQANRATFETSVKGPMAALAEELEEEAGPFHLFRPYNDVRFAKDRPPYKTAQGAIAEAEGGTGRYLQISAEGLMVAAGYYAMAKDQLERFRQAVADESRGADVAARVEALVVDGYSIGAIGELKTAPRGYARDHPRIELLCRKGLMMSRSWPVGAWMHTPKAVVEVREVWAAAGPLCAWLDANVGPSTLAPEDVFGRR